jgi:hypothetical protein
MIHNIGLVHTNDAHSLFNIQSSLKEIMIRFL